MNSEKCANEPVYQKKLAYMKFFSIGPQEVHKPDPGPEKKFPQMLQNSIRSKLDGPIKFTIFQGHI